MPHLCDVRVRRLALRPAFPMRVRITQSPRLLFTPLMVKVGMRNEESTELQKCVRIIYCHRSSSYSTPVESIQTCTQLRPKQSLPPHSICHKHGCKNNSAPPSWPEKSGKAGKNAPPVIGGQQAATLCAGAPDSR